MQDRFAFWGGTLWSGSLLWLVFLCWMKSAALFFENWNSVIFLPRIFLVWFVSRSEQLVQQCGCHERRPRPASVACGGPSRLRPRLSIQFWRVDFFLKMTNSIYVFQLRLRCLQNSRDFVNLCFICRHLLTPASIYFCFLFFPDHLGRLLALLDFSHNLLRGLCALRCCSCR